MCSGLFQPTDHERLILEIEDWAIAPPSLSPLFTAALRRTESEDARCFAAYLPGGRRGNHIRKLRQSSGRQDINGIILESRR
jgi:hypothetical protein